ncbi:MAG: hypothetical protein K1060chlam2_00260 [Chlamydiae bacterium]|nr:hypothetical protein [Chlamydiota bacterium]
MRMLIVSFFMFLLGSSLLSGWDGYNYEEGEYIEINKGNLVRKYNDIEVYHSGDGSYHEEEVQGFSGNELETYDYNTGEFQYYEMD